MKPKPPEATDANLKPKEPKQSSIHSNEAAGCKTIDLIIGSCKMSLSLLHVIPGLFAAVIFPKVVDGFKVCFWDELYLEEEDVASILSGLTREDDEEVASILIGLEEVFVGEAAGFLSFARHEQKMHRG